MGHSRGLALALCAGKMLHVNLQRIACRIVAVDQLARKLNLFLRNFIQRIDLGVIHNGHVQAMIHRFVHENTVEHPARIHVQPERNVAHAKDGLDLRQFLLDPLDGLQRLDSGGAVFFLPRGNGKRERVEDDIHWTNAIFVHGEIKNAVRDRRLFLCGQRHAVFINGQRNDCGAVALRHRQNFRGAFFAIFQVDGVDDGFARNPLQRFFNNVSLGRIHQDRRRHARGDSFENGSDVAFLILADDGTAQIQHVRAVVHQLFRQRQNVIVLLTAHQILEVLNPRGRVHLFSNDQRLGIKIEGNRSVGARSRANRLPISLARLHSR